MAVPKLLCGSEPRLKEKKTQLRNYSLSCVKEVENTSKNCEGIFTKDGSVI
jgi:hypothetical protein